MADSNQVVFVHNSDKFLIAEFTCVSDGTGENQHQKVHAASFTRSIPIEVVQYFSIYEIEATCQGFPYIQLLWFANTPVVIETISSGARFHRCWEDSGGLVDPRAVGSNGDIVLTSPANYPNASYAIKIKLKKKRSSF